MDDYYTADEEDCYYSSDHDESLGGIDNDDSEFHAASSKKSTTQVSPLLPLSNLIDDLIAIVGFKT